METAPSGAVILICAAEQTLVPHPCFPQVILNQWVLGSVSILLIIRHLCELALLRELYLKGCL